MSDKNLKVLEAQVGDNLTVFFDLKLMLNMFSSITGKIVPSFFMKGASKEELQDSVTCNAIAKEIAEFISKSFRFEVD